MTPHDDVLMMIQTRYPQHIEPFKQKMGQMLGKQDLQEQDVHEYVKMLDEHPVLTYAIETHALEKWHNNLLIKAPDEVARLSLEKLSFLITQKFGANHLPSRTFDRALSELTNFQQQLEQRAPVMPYASQGFSSGM